MKKTRKNSAKMNMRHFKTLTARYTHQILTKPAQTTMLIAQVLVMLLILRIVHFDNSLTDPSLAPYGNTSLFIIVFMGSLMGLLNSYREITKEREVLARESAGGLDATAYVMSKIVVQGVIALIQGALLILGTLNFVDYGFANPVLDMIVAIFTEAFVIWVSAALGLLVSASVKNSEAAVLPVLLLIICQVVFSGTLFELDSPASWLGWLCPSTWGAAVLGQLTSFNSLMPGFTRAVYDYSYSTAFIALAVIHVVAVSATISVVAGKGLFDRKNRS